MSNYPRGITDSVVAVDLLQAKVESIFQRCNMSQDDAGLLSDSLVTADLRGVHSHGVLRVPEYVRKLTGGGVDPGGRPRIVSERHAALVVDAGNAMGQVACGFAMRQAIARAARLGVAIAAVRGSNHCGALFYFAMQPLAHGMIGLVATNALPTMAPWGGRDKILGINPIAIAIPSGEEPPLVFDAAFSASSHGKIRIYHQKGLPIPEGWALDAQGQPTTDSGSALEGLLQPVGAYKGTGLAIIMGVLSSFLSGAAFGTELGDMVHGPHPGVDGHFLMAIDVAAFAELHSFRTRVDELVRQIRRSATAPGFDRCYAPGELEHENEAQYRRNGIPLNAETLAGLEECERTLGLA